MQPSDGFPAVTRILIWGGGGHGKVVADIARAAGIEIVGFIDADPAKVDAVVEPGGAKVVITQDSFLEHLLGEEIPVGAESVVLAVGDNASRAWCRNKVPAQFLISLVHPSALVSPSARVAPGAVIMPGAIVNAAASIGAGAIVNTAAVVEHDCIVGDDAHVAPGAVLSGGVKVGARTLIGAGSVVIPQIVIGADATVRAGAVVVSAVADGSTFASNRAKRSIHNS